jgi:hypothetical protein
MTNLHDALEVCLQAITDGQSPETALSFYPELRAELEPLLRAVQAARGPAYADFPEEVRRRGRSRFLQRAAQIREGRAAPSSRPISFLPRTAITLAVVVVLVLSSTGLVSASSGALPGDQLYGVKRSWEDLRLLLVAQPQQRYLLESEFDQERLNEIGGLLARRRAESISFAGLVMRKNDGTWVVSGIPVSITSSTRLPSNVVAASAPVQIAGITRSDGVVEARQIALLQPGVALPPLEPSDDGAEAGQESHASAAATPGPVAAAPTAEASQPVPGEAAQPHQFLGIVQSISANEWQINGQPVYLDGADVAASIQVGSEVRFEGYYAFGWPVHRNKDGSHCKPLTQERAGRGRLW